MIPRKLRSRVGLLLVVISSCVYWSDEGVAAKNTDGSLVLTRDVVDLVGCGGGGHFVIVPTLETETRYDLEIETGPRAGTYSVSPSDCGCPTGTGEITSSEDRWLVQWQCEGEAEWVGFVPLQDEWRTRCYRGAAPLDVAKPLSHNFGAMANVSPASKALIDRIRQTEGVDGVVRALQGAVSMRNEKLWSEIFSTLTDPQKALIRAEIRKAASAPNAARNVLAKAAHLDDTDRELVKSSAIRLMDRAFNPVGTGYVHPEPLVVSLAHGGVEDLADVICAINFYCTGDCAKIRTAAGPCPEPSSDD